MRRAFANKVDSTAKALIAETRAYGYAYLPINGVIDGLIKRKDGSVIVVEWKGPNTPRTTAQQKLVDEGWDLAFIRTSEQLQTLLFGGRKR